MVATAKPQLDVICGDFRQIVPNLGREFQMAFADPPDNIGLKYGEFDDRIDDYEAFLFQMLETLFDAADTSWVSFNAKWTLLMGRIVDDLQKSYYDHVEVKPCVQVFTFGQHNMHDLGNGHRPLWRFREHDAPLYPESVKVPSWRQLNGDKRAAKGGRVPLDTINADRFCENTLPLPNLSLGDIDRLMSKIDFGDDDSCWEWTAGKRNGYGRIQFNKKLYTATRLVWRLVHGTDPAGQFILHKCDNPSCCNPSHLFLGTHKDNNHDKESKGRGNHPRGSKNGLATLSEADVLEIYHTTGVSNRDLASRHGVSDVTVGNIRKGKTWGHVTQNELSDVFRVPRVTGNSKQRRKWHPTQLGEALLERCILLCTKPGDTVLDPFAGTGTTLRVCKRLGRNCVTIDVDANYCRKIAAENDCKVTYEA